MVVEAKLKGIMVQSFFVGFSLEEIIQICRFVVLKSLLCFKARQPRPRHLLNKFRGVHGLEIGWWDEPQAEIE
jgi:hypothetical protein